MARIDPTVQDVGTSLSAALEAISNPKRFTPIPPVGPPPGPAQWVPTRSRPPQADSPKTRQEVFGCAPEDTPWLFTDKAITKELANSIRSSSARKRRTRLSRTAPVSGNPGEGDPRQQMKTELAMEGINLRPWDPKEFNYDADSDLQQTNIRLRARRPVEKDVPRLSKKSLKAKKEKEEAEEQAKIQANPTLQIFLERSSGVLEESLRASVEAQKSASEGEGEATKPPDESATTTVTEQEGVPKKPLPALPVPSWSKFGAKVEAGREREKKARMRAQVKWKVGYERAASELFEAALDDGTESPSAGTSIFEAAMQLQGKTTQRQDFVDAGGPRKPTGGLAIEALLQQMKPFHPEGEGQKEDADLTVYQRQTRRKGKSPRRSLSRSSNRSGRSGQRSPSRSKSPPVRRRPSSPSAASEASAASTGQWSVSTGATPAAQPAAVHTEHKAFSQQYHKDLLYFNRRVADEIDRLTNHEDREAIYDIKQRNLMKASFHRSGTNFRKHLESVTEEVSVHLRHKAVDQRRSYTAEWFSDFSDTTLRLCNYDTDVAVALEILRPYFEEDKLKASSFTKLVKSTLSLRLLFSDSVQTVLACLSPIFHSSPEDLQDYLRERHVHYRHHDTNATVLIEERAQRAAGIGAGVPSMALPLAETLVLDGEDNETFFGAGAKGVSQVDAQTISRIHDSLMSHKSSLGVHHSQPQHSNNGSVRGRMKASTAGERFGSPVISAATAQLSHSKVTLDVAQSHFSSGEDSRRDLRMEILTRTPREGTGAQTARVGTGFGSALFPKSYPEPHCRTTALAPLRVGRAGGSQTAR